MWDSKTWVMRTPAARGEAEHAVEVALRVDDERHPAVMGEVGAVAEAGGVERQDGDHRGSSQAAVATGRPDSIHSPVPPATLVASMPTARRSAVAWALRPPAWQMT